LKAAVSEQTPRGSDMLGTLVVCLPAQFSNGPFVVKHHGVFQTYDRGDAIRDQAESSFFAKRTEARSREARDAYESVNDEAREAATVCALSAG
jgi:hypothetical protein